MSVQKIAIDRTVALLTNMAVHFRIEFEGSVFTNILPPPVEAVKMVRSVRYGFFDATRYKQMVDGMELGKEITFCRTNYPELFFSDTNAGDEDWKSFVACVSSRASQKWRSENLAFEGTVASGTFTLMRVA